MKSLLVFSVVVLFGFVAARDGRTQELSPDAFRNLISTQLVESLESPLPTVRSQTLKNAIVFSTLFRDRVDLRPSVPVIARLAREDAAGSNRRLAVAALRSINTPRARRYLAELSDMEDEEYGNLVAGVLSEYATGSSEPL